MSDRAHATSRRRFLQTLAAGAAAVPAMGLLVWPRATTAQKPKLDPDAGQAKALDYVHDARQARDHPAYRAGSRCANCLQWTGGASTWGGCNIFPNHRVRRDGWCSAWAEA